VPITTFSDGSGWTDVMLFQNSLTPTSLQPGGQPLPVDITRCADDGGGIAARGGLLYLGEPCLSHAA
jgi:hypothetical protein